MQTKTTDMLVDVQRETDGKITALAKKENSAVICFIAPFIPRRVSPVHFRSAEIFLAEEFGMEKVVNEIKKSGAPLEKLILLLHSPGGAVTSSYKIAKLLRKNFKDITVVVPHIAASGGTMMALTGDRIVMGDISQLSPLDTQVPYQGTHISAKTVIDSMKTLSNFFKDKTVDEVPYTYKALADKLDHLMIEEWSAALRVTHKYATEILVNSLASVESKKNSEEKKMEDNELLQKAVKITTNLVYGYDTHGDVIDYEGALGLGLNVKASSEFGDTWECLGDWFRNYVLKASDKHHIRYAFPPLENELNETVEKGNSTGKGLLTQDILGGTDDEE